MIVEAIILAVGIYAGGSAIEDGLKELADVLKKKS